MGPDIYVLDSTDSRWETNEMGKNGRLPLRWEHSCPVSTLKLAIGRTCF